MPQIPPVLNNREIGKRMRFCRKKSGYSQEALSEKLSLTPNYYGQLERGERSLSMSAAIRFCSFFQITFDQLLFGIGFDAMPSEDIVCEGPIASPSCKDILLDLIEHSSEKDCAYCLPIALHLLTCDKDNYVPDPKYFAVLEKLSVNQDKKV